MVGGIRTLALASLFVAGCANWFLPGFTTFESAWSNGVDEYRLRLVDQSGLVESIRTGSAQSPVGGASRTSWATPERNEVELVWLGGPCHPRPTITITGTAKQFVAKLDHGAQPQTCADVGQFMGVTLTLSAPVQQDAVRFVVAE